LREIVTVYGYSSPPARRTYIYNHSMTKIGITDDNLALLRSLRQDLEATQQFDIVFTANNGSACLKQLASLVAGSLPNVILMDISMPELNGISTTSQIRNLYPSIQVIMLTAIDEDDSIFEAIKAGAKAYLLKDEPTAKIVTAIQDVQGGGTQFTPSIARKALDFVHQTLLQADKKPLKVEEMLATLTTREQEVLNYLANGFTYQQMADKLDITIHTLKRHSSNIFLKLEVSNRTQAINKLKS
jgi:DNA-binding NarL/FixJ family response regulator